MKLRAVALAYGFGLVLATAAWAATPKAPMPADHVAPSSSVEEGAIVPIQWVPDWLMEPLSRAIADATDTRDRKVEH